MQTPAYRKWLLLISAVMLWGSSFALLKVAVETITPVWIMALRLVIGGAVLTALLFAIGKRFSSDASSWATFFAIAVIGNVIPFFLITWGIRHIPSGLSGILMAVMPLGVAVLAHFFIPDEPLTLKKTLGFLLGFTGVCVLVGADRLLAAKTGGIALWGQMAMIAGALCYSVQSIITRRMPNKGAMETAAAALAIAGVLGLILALSFDPTGMDAASLRSLVAVGVIGLFTTALATLVFFQLIKLAGPGFASMINYLIPLYAVAVGWIFLDERLAPSVFVGLALILGGISFVQSRRQH